MMNHLRLVAWLQSTTSILRMCSFLTRLVATCPEKTVGTKAVRGKLFQRVKYQKNFVVVKDSHFIITLITNAANTLQYVTVNFSNKKLLPEWTLGIDIFSDWDTSDEFDFLLSPEKGKEVLVLFTANQKVSTTSSILKKASQKVDESEITLCGVDENGNTYRPAAVIDSDTPGWAKTSWGMSITKRLIGKWILAHHMAQNTGSSTMTKGKIEHSNQR